MAIAMEVRATPVGALKDDAVVLLLTQGEDGKAAVTSAGKPFVAGYARLVEAKAFEAKAGQTVTLSAPARHRIGHLVLAGMGERKDQDDESVRQATAAGVRAARGAGARSVSVVVPKGRGAHLRVDRATEAVAEAIVTGLYRFEAYKSEKAPLDVEKTTVVVPRGTRPRAEKAARAGRVVGRATCLARDLGNEPGNTATPRYLAAQAERIAEEHGLGLRVLDERDMEKLGMGALLGVAKGSAEPPRLIVLTYEPKRRRGRVDTVALVGKGLTFDTGGISIKPSAKLEDMKFDMCGGAAVLGTMSAVADLGVPVRVVGLVPASENMPGGASYKPGDILKAMNGKTIEVKNTDAEGRLILADALAYATSRLRPRPKALVDLATLTGACVVALADLHAGLMGTDDGLQERLRAAGEVSGDRLWPLPLTAGHARKLESSYADVANLAMGGGGAMTAAAFLKNFVGSVPWAHLDIAGTAWTDKPDSTRVPGATGFGVRVLCRALRDWPTGR